MNIPSFRVPPWLIAGCTLMLLLSGCCLTPSGRGGWKALFPADGIPEGWTVRDWADLRNPPAAGAVWRVVNGVLQGSEPRGTWLVSEAQYGDFELQFDFLLGPLGNSGCALRAPMHGDPAFDGLELQMADFRYNTNATSAELTGGFYRALAPSQQVYRPTEWNSYRIRCKGSEIRVQLNGTWIQRVDLNRQTLQVKRHDGTLAPPLRDRPRRGHIGFQELSRGGDHVRIRNAFIRALD